MMRWASKSDARRRTARALAVTAFVISLFLSLPAALVTLLLVFNMVNPMTLMFATSFDVQNDSGEPVRIWVAGTGEHGQLGLLPLYATTFPTIPAFRAGGFTIAPGMRKRIKYDWDDYNFTLILVETPRRGLLALPVDVEDRKPGCCWRHRKDVYVIPAVDALRLANAEESVLAHQSRSFWVVLGPAILLPFLSIYLYRLQRSLRPFALPSGEPPSVADGVSNRGHS